jgi:hypothetical protein
MMNTNKQIGRVQYLKDIVIKEYVVNDAITLTELSKKYKCGIGTLSNLLKKEGIRVREKYHDITFNYWFDSIKNEEQAYWLGFLYADGTTSYDPSNVKNIYKIELGLAAKDLEHLKKFKLFLGTPNNINFREKTNSYRLIISSKKLCINLYNLGFRKGKTYIDNVEEIIKNVPNEYYSHFLRGYTDGDGSIFKDGTVSYTSNFIETILKLIKNVPFELEYKSYIRNNRSPRICITRKKYFLPLLNYLYKDSNIYLDRKYEKYIAVLNRNI